MTVEIDAEVLVDGARGTAHDMTRELADVWFSTANDELAEADSKYDDSNYFPIMQSGYPPQWDEKRGAWVFGFSHLAAVFAEWGTEPHEIKAKEAQFLAFEWPDAPEEVREQFEATFPLVFFKRVWHPGTPEIGYVRAGREEAVALARRGGLM